MGVLTYNKLHANQRIDKEDLDFLIASLRADSKFFINSFWSTGTYIFQGFDIISTGVGSVTISQASGTLINAANTGAFSWFAEESTASNLTVTTSEGLVYNTRNYIELTLTTEDGTPLTKAFWDQAANSGVGEEFNQTVNTVTNLKVTAAAKTGSFTAGDDTVPIAIVDVDVSGNIKTIFDARNLFFRLGTASDPSHNYSWSSRVDSETTLTFTGLVGSFVVGETITFAATETAEVTDISGMGTGSIKVNKLSANTFSIGDALLGAGSGATATLSGATQAFDSADKDIKSLKELINAFLTEIKLMKGTDFWFTLGSSSISGLNSFINSIITPVTSGAKVSWDGSALTITDGSGAPADADVLAKIRLHATVQELGLTRQDGTGGSTTLSIADGEILYVELPSSGNRDWSGAGSGSTNYRTVARGSFSPTDQNYWVAYREGAKIFFRGVGELIAGESSEIGDNVPASLLANLGLVDEVTAPSYSSDIRGTAAESLVSRIGVNTDAIGDEQEDRSAFLRSDDVVVWDGSQLSFASNIELKIINKKAGGTTTHSILVAGSPISLTDGQIAYIDIDRTINENVSVTIAASLPAQTQANKDIIPIFQRIDAGGAGYLHIPLHKQLLEPGQSVRLGASGAGGGEGAAFGFLLDELPFRVAWKDSFDDQTLIDSTETTASYSAANKAFTMSYDAGKTGTTTGTSLTLSGAPAFTVAVGDIIWATVSGNKEVRKITALGSINSDGGSGTPATIEAAFSSDLSSDACCVSQKVQSKDGLNYYNSSDAESRPASELVGHIALSGKSGSNFDHAEQPEWLTPAVNDIILQYDTGVLDETYISALVDSDTFTVNDATDIENGDAYIIRPMSSYIVGYYDDGWTGDVNIGYTAITTQDAAAAWANEYGYLRKQNFSDDQEKITIQGTAGGHFFIRFYANKTSGSGTVTFYEYDSVFYEESDFANGGIHDQAWCRTDGAGTEINCTVSVVSTKTRVAFTGDFSGFVSGVNSGKPFGDLEVYLDGKEIPRYVDATVTPGAYYTEDANGGYIDLDSDYSASSFGVSVKRKIGTKDTSDDNSTRITRLETLKEDIVYFKDVKTSGTDGGTFTAAAWQTRTINTTENSKSWATLSSNQITLDTGTYEIEASAPAYGVDSHQTRFYNVSDTTDAIIGSSEMTAAGNNVVTRSVIKGIITIAAQKIFELRHRCDTTRATNGYGLACNFGVDEIYSIVKIRRIDDA